MEFRIICSGMMSIELEKLLESMGFVKVILNNKYGQFTVYRKK